MVVGRIPGGVQWSQKICFTDRTGIDKNNHGWFERRDAQRFFHCSVPAWGTSKQSVLLQWKSRPKPLTFVIHKMPKWTTLYSAFLMIIYDHLVAAKSLSSIPSRYRSTNILFSYDGMVCFIPVDSTSLLLIHHRCVVAWKSTCEARLYWHNKLPHYVSGKHFLLKIRLDESTFQR